MPGQLPGLAGSLFELLARPGWAGERSWQRAALGAAVSEIHPVKTLFARISETYVRRHARAGAIE